VSNTCCGGDKLVATMTPMRFPRWRKYQMERLVQAHAAHVSAHQLLQQAPWQGKGSVLACVDLADEVTTELFNWVESHMEGRTIVHAEPSPVEAQLEHITQPELEQNPDPKPTQEDN